MAILWVCYGSLRKMSAIIDKCPKSAMGPPWVYQGPAVGVLWVGLRTCNVCAPCVLGMCDVQTMCYACPALARLRMCHVYAMVVPWACRGRAMGTPCVCRARATNVPCDGCATDALRIRYECATDGRRMGSVCAMYAPNVCHVCAVGGPRVWHELAIGTPRGRDKMCNGCAMCVLWLRFGHAMGGLQICLASAMRPPRPI